MFKNIKDQSPTIQLFFLFALFILGFMLYVMLQSVIVLNAFPDIEGKSETDMMTTIMSSKTGVSQLLLILQQVLFFLVPGILMAYFLKKDQQTIYHFNLKWKAFISPIFLLLIAIFGFSFLSYLNLELIKLLPNADYLIGMDQDQGGIVKTVTANNSTYLFVLNIIGIAVLPAIGEELIFRGFLIRNFYQNSNNMYFAIFGSSALFALIHFQPVKLIPMFLMGLLFAVIYVKTKNLWIPMLLHFINNLVSLIFLKYEFQDYSENLWISGIAAAYLVFRMLMYLRELRTETIE